MKIGVNILNYGPGTDPQGMEAWVRTAEDLGFHFAMISDHITLPPEVAGAFPPPFYDPFTTLAWLAGRTTRIELGTTVTVIPYRHPLHLARVTANLDQFSDGRLILGAGLGWSRQEFAALGIDFEARGRITDEYLSCLLRHWAEPKISFHGSHTDFADIATGPAPQRRPPLWIGGLGGPALRRTARFGDAWHPFGLGPAELRQRLPILRAAAEAAGRPTPALAPRICLHITDRPLPETGRPCGHGSLEQIRADLEALADLHVSHVLLDPFLTTYLGLVSPENSPRHDPDQLHAVAEHLADLAHETLR